MGPRLLRDDEPPHHARHFAPTPVPREAAEREEHANYHGRIPAEWFEALAPFGTDEHKLHLTDAPWVVVAFRRATPDPMGFLGESLGRRTRRRSS